MASEVVHQPTEHYVWKVELSSATTTTLQASELVIVAKIEMSAACSSRSRWTERVLICEEK